METEMMDEDVEFFTVRDRSDYPVTVNILKGYIRGHLQELRENNREMVSIQYSTTSRTVREREFYSASAMVVSRKFSELTHKI